MNTAFRIIIMCLIGIVSWNIMGEAEASTIAYQGQNPALFPGANPNNSAAMLATVVKPNNTHADSSSNLFDDAQLIKQGLDSQISSQITQEIFNKTGYQVNGNHLFTLSDGTQIAYTRGTDGNGPLVVTITGANGKVTTINLGDL